MTLFRLLTLLAVPVGLFLALAGRNERACPVATATDAVNELLESEISPALPARKVAKTVDVSGALVSRVGERRFRHTSTITAVAFRPGGATVAASASASHAVLEWDAITGRELRRYRTEGGRFATLLNYTRGGNRLLVRLDTDRWNAHELLAFDTATGAVAARIEYGACATVSPDEQFVAGPARDGQLTLWELATGRAVRTFPVTTSFGVTFSPDGKWLTASLEPEVVPGRPFDLVPGVPLCRECDLAAAIAVLATAAVLPRDELYRMRFWVGPVSGEAGRVIELADPVPHTQGTMPLWSPAGSLLLVARHWRRSTRRRANRRPRWMASSSAALRRGSRADACSFATKGPPDRRASMTPTP